jgi:hypothetical protein
MHILNSSGYTEMSCVLHKILYYFYLQFFQRTKPTLLLGCILLLITACGAGAKQPLPLQSGSLNQSFQNQTSPIPTVPEYRCGAWSSNNAPGPDSTIAIYAKLTKNVQGVAEATAKATVHFKGQDVTLPGQAVSDAGGYVNFTLPLMGRQPSGVPATVDVTFHVGNQAVSCSPAFFTP